MGDFCREKKSEYKTEGIISTAEDTHTSIKLLKSREQMFNDKNIIIEWMQYKKQCFDAARTPKKEIQLYCDTNQISLPTYESNMIDQRFYSIITLEEKQYTTVIGHRNKRIAEQAAALVCGFRLGLYEEDFLLSIGCLIERC